MTGTLPLFQHQIGGENQIQPATKKISGGVNEERKRRATPQWKSVSRDTRRKKEKKTKKKKKEKRR